MRKRVFLFVSTIICATLVISCQYDDRDLWKSIDDVNSRINKLEAATNTINGDLTSLQTIVNALKNNVTITDIVNSADGYVIKFSNGTTATIANGKDGKDGTNAPTISLKRDNDKRLYWTIDGSFLIIDGEKVCAEGIDGADGKDGVSPQVRINEKTQEWEVSVDGGNNWTSTGVIAQGKDGQDGAPGSSASCLFSGIETDSDDFVRFILNTGISFDVPRHKNDAPSFSIDGLSSTETFGYGLSKSYTVLSSNVADYSISKPNGWLVSLDENTLTIQAPSASNIYAETEGYVAFNLVSDSGKGFIYKIRVKANDGSAPEKTIKYLTFEDSDFKATPYVLEYAGQNKTISKWSDLIDNPQYGGWLLYGNMMECGYYWYDENNTELMAQNPTNWGSTVYWGGGHAISNYVDKDLKHGDFNHQLSIYGNSGHNGSENFCVHYGYRDNSGFSADNLPYFFFGDGEARVVDHMYVTNTTYAMNCYLDGNGLTAKIGPEDWVKLVAIGFDANGVESGTVEMYLVNGPDNIVDDWTKWDLSSLGKVTRIEFNVTGSSDNGYGFSQPAYFAYDDVAVVFE